MSECKHMPKLKEAELMTRPFREIIADQAMVLGICKKILGYYADESSWWFDHHCDSEQDCMCWKDSRAQEDSGGKATEALSEIKRLRIK